jgi:cation transport ATPase
MGESMTIPNIKIGAVLTGWIAAIFSFLAIIAFSGAILLKIGFDPMALVGNANSASTQPPLIIYAVIFGSIPAAFFVGGYVAGRMAAISGIANGIMTIVTSILFAALAVIFVSIVGQKLDVNLVGMGTKLLSPFMMYFFLALILATITAVLGGKYGEGYIDRLSDSLNKELENSTSADTALDQNS